MSNFREMTPQRLKKNLKLLRYEYIIYSFEARDRRPIIAFRENSENVVFHETEFLNHKL